MDEPLVRFGRPEDHLHGPTCGHVSIAHCNAQGDVHVGFISEEGDLICYAAPANVAPKGSLFNICLKSAPGKKGVGGMHRITPLCRTADANCWEEAEHFLLEPVSTNECQISSAHCHHNDHGEQAHDHENESQTTRVIKHDDHLDLFLSHAADEDRLDLHCKSSDAKNEKCHVHGSLRRVRPDAVPSQDNWLDLFVFTNQTSTSTLRITKGLCCKKEVSKIEETLASVCQAHDLKIQVHVKSKLLTVWHGSDVKSWLAPMMDALNMTGVFHCEIDTIKGEPVTSCQVSALLPTMHLEIPHVLHVSKPVEEDGSYVLHYLQSDQDLVLRQVVGNNPKCVLLRLGGAPVFAHTIGIAKGLCCKKEVVKVERAVEHIAGLLCLRVHYKEKYVVCFTTQPDFVLDTVHKSLAANGFTLFVEQPQDEEEAQHGHSHANGKEAQHGHGHGHQEDALPTFASFLPATATIGQEKLALPEAIEVADVDANPSSSHEGGGGLTRSVLSVKGVCCAAEVPSVLAVCNEVPGVSFASVSVISKQVYFKHERQDAQIALLVAKRLTDNGFTSNVLVNGGSETKPVHLNESAAKQSRARAARSAVLAKWHVLLATLLWLVAWLAYIGGSFEPLKYLAVVAVALTLPSIAYKGVLSLRRRIMDINILMSIAVIGALAIQDFSEAATVTVIFSWSEWLEERASRKAKGALQALVDLKPEVARTEEGEDISVDNVVLDQVLIVRPGDKIPVDGVLLSPTCDCDESNLTGESRPVTKAMGELLNAGTLNVSPGMIKMRCTALAENSAVNRMIHLVEEAAQSRSPTEQIVERVAKVYTPLVVLVALLLATIPWSQGSEVGHEYLTIALTLLVVACPCALIISTPITYVCSMAQAATFGVMVKGGKHLETLSVLDCLCCDKTGTLTKGQFEVNDCLVLVEEEREQAFAFELLMRIEQHATHPIALALGRYSQSRMNPRISFEIQVTELEILPGTGVQARLSNGSTARVVNKLEETAMNAAAASWLAEHEGKTICWLIFNNRVLLGLAASDEVRESSPEFVHQLVSDAGVRVVVLTGDNLGSAKMLQRAIPQLVDVFAGLTPEGKVDHVRKLKEEGHTVGVCGDGVNDAPAFSIASIGIAMGVSGAPLAIETADVALMDNDLTKIARLLRLARRTRWVIIQNITFALVTKMVMLGLTFAGMISLGVAIAVDVGSMLLVTLNGVSLLEVGGRRFGRVTTAAKGQEQRPISAMDKDKQEVMQV